MICVLVGIGSWGLANLKQDFDPNWFLPPGTDTVAYNEANDNVSNICYIPIFLSLCQSISNCIEVSHVNFLKFSDIFMRGVSANHRSISF